MDKRFPTTKEVHLTKEEKKFLDDFTKRYKKTYSESIRLMIDYYIRSMRVEEIEKHGKRTNRETT